MKKPEIQHQVTKGGGSWWCFIVCFFMRATCNKNWTLDIYIKKCKVPLIQGLPDVFYTKAVSSSVHQKAGNSQHEKTPAPLIH